MTRPSLRQIRALVLDVDGVLTDGGMYYGEGGEALKKFNVKDGLGIRLLQKAGIRVALISGEKSNAIRLRARKLEVSQVFLGVEDKERVFLSFLKTENVDPLHAAYVGDDLNDLPAMRKAGVAIAVADAVPEVRREADWILARRGGDAAVREICDALLKSRDRT
jgi:YrbI family 3-deoxy-D-manno-octulosonate 8-phosphate phosphatase